MPASRRSSSAAPARESRSPRREARPPQPVTDDSSKSAGNDFRFRRHNRLSDASSYSAVFKNSKRSRDAFFTVLYRPSGVPEPRLGLAIAKKHCKLATGRNRIKRLVRQSFRLHQHDLQGFDLVVMNTRATHGADNRTLTDSLARHWQRVTRSQQKTTG